jgi:hypothetical protein
MRKMFLCFMLAVAGLNAMVIGTLTTNACLTGGVTYTTAEIDFLPAGGGAGCLQTGIPTSITYSTDTLTNGITGTLKDVTLGGGPALLPDFMMFDGHSALHFDLLQLGSGIANLTCASVLDPAAPACSLAAGSRVVLYPGFGGTTAVISAFGQTRDDGDNTIGLWRGTISSSFAGETPEQVRARFAASGSITAGHTGSFVAEPVPEVATICTVAFALLLMPVAKLAKAKAKA